MAVAGLPYKGLRALSDRSQKRKRYPENLDRFIPNRSAMDFDFAHFMLTGGQVKKEDLEPYSPSKEAYRKRLAEVLNMNRPRILAFRDKPPHPVVQDPIPSAYRSPPTKRSRRVPQSPARTLDAPEVVDDFYLNLLDWGSGNVVAIGLGYSVYLWDASNGSTKELLEVDEDTGPVTSVKWARDGRHLAVGLTNSHIQIWDSSEGRRLRTLSGGHILRVGSLDWNNHILTSGGKDSLIINNDVRVVSHVVAKYGGHTGEVCGLKWSANGQYLASGGNDHLVYIWKSGGGNRWLHRMTDHTAAVKALAWCPFQSNLLATGGGMGDNCIRFWNTQTRACLNCINTGSQVSGLVWSIYEREILSSHGYERNQLILWKYPAMVKMRELYGHTSRVLSMAQSPDGYVVASVAADEMLNMWNVFGTPEVAKPEPMSYREPFGNAVCIR